MSPLFCLLIAIAPADAPKAVRFADEAGAKQPQAAVAGDGAIHVVYGVGDEIRHRVSRDEGASWSEPAVVGSPGVLALGMRRGPRVAVSDGAVVVTAIGGETGRGLDGELYAWRSTDEGRSWGPRQSISTSPGACREGLHALASGPGGRLFCAWVDLRSGSPEIRGAGSNDGGATWGANEVIPRMAGDRVCPCCHPSAAFAPDGTLYVMWRGELGGYRDMMLAHSTDGGTTFEPTVKLGDGTWKFDACPMDGGSIAFDQAGQPETVWMREGKMFSAAPAAPERELGRGVQGWTAGQGPNRVAVWLEARPGTLMASIDGGEPTPLARIANDPMAAATPDGLGPVVVVWEGGQGRGLFAACVSK